MPTDILRKRSGAAAGPAAKKPGAPAAAPRRLLIKAGRIVIEAELLDTPTANRIWAALPLHSTVETWGRAIKFELPIESGRERGAKVLACPGEIYFIAEDDRVIIAFGPTPISRPGEMRLPKPSNAWARTQADVTALGRVTPGEKVSITVA